MLSQRPPPIVKKEPTVVYYNDALDTFTYIIVVLIISFFIFIILKDLYRSLKLYYSNIRIPKVKMNMFDGKSSYDDDNQFESNDYRNNNWSESIKYMMNKKNKVLEDEFSIIREFKEINQLPSDLHTSISIANIKDSDDEYEYNKKDGQMYQSNQLFIEKNPHNITDKDIISLSPGGLNGFYMAGVVSFLKQQYDLSNCVFTGASAGAWNALYMCCNADHDTFIDKLFETQLNHSKYSL